MLLTTTPVQRVQRLTLIAILSAISFGLMLFPQLPLIPGADFLKLDFSIVPIIIALSWLGMTAAIWVVFLRTILKLILANEGVNTYLGLPVNVAVVLTFILVLGLMMSQKMQWHQKLIAMVISVIAITVVAMIINWLVAIPLYATFANFDINRLIGIKTYLFGMVMPFNLIQGIIWFVTGEIAKASLTPLWQKIVS
ncbi:ECF transporter S component [Leuconostoc falkenbergense]|uniref:ECF transporter S component n=1 Tax=Leuconostoc falkenbergense TaxID=2766470 RepID=UPI0028AF8F71|nr:ECF transporter S component [Leuconostoc falkenbergense]